MVFLKIIGSFVKGFRNYHLSSVFSKSFLNSKHCNSENIEDFRKVQRQIYSKIVQVYLKPFSSKKDVIEFHTQLFEDLKLMLCYV